MNTPAAALPFDESFDHFVAQLKRQAVLYAVRLVWEGQPFAVLQPLFATAEEAQARANSLNGQLAADAICHYDVIPATDEGYAGL